MIRINQFRAALYGKERKGRFQRESIRLNPGVLVNRIVDTDFHRAKEVADEFRAFGFGNAIVSGRLALVS